MESNDVSTRVTDVTLQKAVKIAGFMFLFAFIVPTLNWTFILSNYIVLDDSVATAENITNNELMYRIGITIELIMSIGLVLLGVALYTMLKSTNKSLGLIALSLKLIEASISTVITVGSFVALLIISNESDYFNSISSGSLQAIAGLLLQKHTELYSIPMLFLGIDMMIFSFLFCKSGYIPSIIARFGIISFFLIFIHSLMFIIAPEYAAMPIIQAIFWIPSGIFELIIGTWLLVKGIKIS